MTDKPDVQNVCDFLAATMAQAPIDRWAAWLVYLVQGLEAEAMDLDPDHPAGFETTLQRLQDTITDRLNDGKWPRVTGK